MDASVSAGSAVSRGPDADVGMFPDAIVATPAFLSPAVGGFLLGVSATGVSLDPASIRRFRFPDDGRLRAQLGGRLA
ncbi:hypothetical protein [Bifidobacterium longum]|jgi:hypothetical protein|uniref:hypothetical protein n=1 Tax=Bifidobacterium longum TaxID=216816 RepID=UPI003B990E49